MMTVGDIVRCSRGRLLKGDAQKEIANISTDTRTLAKGSLFVALKGKNFDGHKFVEEALKKGASALLVSRRINVPSNPVSVIRVQDTLRAYGDLARYHRTRFSIPVVAITGSVGKTTTKELLGSVLASRYNIIKNYQTENNEIGVAKTVLGLRSRHQIAVLEFGTNHFGEIRRLACIGQPTVAVLTNIGESHLEFLKDRRGVFKEKSDIFKYLAPQGYIVYNKDDDLLKEISGKKLSARKLTFAINKKADYQATRIVFNDKGLSFYVNRRQFFLQTLSRENIYNALAAIAVGRLQGLSWEKIRRSLAGAAFPKGRQNIFKANGVWVIDDTYNANPTSVASALRTAGRFEIKGKRFFIFGDMRELGTASKKAHEHIGDLVVENKIDVLLTYGRWSKLTSQKVRSKVLSCHFLSHEEILNILKKSLSPGDLVLVKGSRGMRMEKIAEKIKTFHF